MADKKEALECPASSATRSIVPDVDHDAGTRGWLPDAIAAGELLRKYWDKIF
jgi:hypothetical protein